MAAGWIDTSIPFVKPLDHVLMLPCGDQTWLAGKSARNQFFFKLGKESIKCKYIGFSWIFHCHVWLWKGKHHKHEDDDHAEVSCWKKEQLWFMNAYCMTNCYIYNGDVTCSNLCISNDAHTCPRCFYMDIQPMFIQGWSIFRSLCDVPPWRCTMHPSISGPGTNTWPSAWSTSLWREAMLKQFLSRFYVFFPTCQVRVVRFSVSCPARLPPPAFCSTSSAGPQLQPQLQALDCSGPLNCKLLIAVVPAGPQLQAPDQSGPCRSLTASSECSPPDFNHKESPKIYQIECQKESQNIYVYM